MANKDEPNAAINPEFRVNLHVSEKVAFFHFIDKISGWHPDTRSDTVNFTFLDIPEPSEKDKAQLRRYSEARKPFGFESETELFLWAENDFPLQDKPPAYAELKAVVDHFFAKPEFREPLKRRLQDLERIKPKVIAHLGQIDDQLGSLRGVTDVFLKGDSPRWNDVPMFLVYSLAANSLQGGSNGYGIYIEVDPSASLEKILGQSDIVLLHEALHHALHPGDAYLASACQGWSKRARAHCQALRQSAPDERGDPESNMLEEILVYALSGVIIGGQDEDAEFERVAKRGDKQDTRLWNGVQILLPTIRRQIENPESNELFLHRLIETFASKVHFKVWKSPLVKSQASSFPPAENFGN